jgi:hypothetical protein
LPSPDLNRAWVSALKRGHAKAEVAILSRRSPGDPSVESCERILLEDVAG